jgi:hypothetical protein
MDNSDGRVSFEGYQYSCAWGTTKQVYDVTGRIKKSVQSSDLVQQMTVVSHCASVSICWDRIVKTSEVLGRAATDLLPTIHSASFHFKSVGGESTGWVARAAIFTPGNEIVQPWEELKLEYDNGYSYSKWRQWSV